MELEEEKQIIDMCRKDPAHFGPIYDANFRKIFNYILHRVGNVALAEDLTAQTFIRAIDKLWQFRWKGLSISSWLYRLATNEVNSYYRKQKRNPVQYEEKLIERVPDLVRINTELEQAEAEVSRKEVFNDLFKVIKTLKETDQAVIVLRYFEHKSYADIAAIIGKREATLRMQSKRALEKLKRKLTEQGIDNEKYRETIAECQDALS